MYTVKALGQQAKVVSFFFFFAGVVIVVHCSSSYCRGQKTTRIKLRPFSSNTCLNVCIDTADGATAWTTKGEYQGKKISLSWLNFQSTSSPITACKTHVDARKRQTHRTWSWKQFLFIYSLLLASHARYLLTATKDHSDLLQLESYFGSSGRHFYQLRQNIPRSNCWDLGTRRPCCLNHVNCR